VPSKDWKPWWEKTFDTPQEHEEFLRGLAGARPISNKSSGVLLALVAGYVGGKVSQFKGKK
jgi:hypothetical protein